MTVLRIFGWSFAVTAASLVAAFLYGGTTALFLCVVLGILEVSLSFDNAVVNATILRRMSAFWQRLFLTVGVLIAVFGMRLVFPILIVSLSADLGPIEAVQLALQGGDVETPGTYANILEAAHPSIAAFGGVFLLMLFLNYMFDDHEFTWIGPVERLLTRVGSLANAAVLVASGALLASAAFLTDETGRVLLAGLLGLVTYLLVNGLGDAFEAAGDTDDTSEESTGDDDGDGATTRRGPSALMVVTGRAAFFLFLYLEVLDATFSFDGVIGAFAITSDPIIIALGLGLIGAMFVRSLTVYLVRQGTLDDYVYLESGAHWAIGALAVILLLTIGIEVNALVTGVVGVVIILAAFGASLWRNRRLAKAGGDATEPEDPDEHLTPSAPSTPSTLSSADRGTR